MNYELIFRFHAHVEEHEREDIDHFVNGLVEGFATTVTSVTLNADKVRLVTDVAVLQRRRVLERVCRNHTVVVVSCGHQDSRILLAVLDGV